MSLPEKWPLRIAMVAGEASGDLLGAGLIQAIKAKHPDAVFWGIGGERMIDNGFTSIVPMERLAVMGLVEVLGRLWELLGIRRKLLNNIMAQQPDVFIGIDSPDFNLPVEKKLHEAGMLTVHYVSPSVWAWRQGRVHAIAQSVDLMLTLFPFEAAFYQAQNMPVQFVGHPLADTITMEDATPTARRQLGFSMEDRIIALLPGSRATEIRYLAETFIKTAHYCFNKNPHVRFVIPCVNKMRQQEIETVIQQLNCELPIMLLEGQAQTALAAADTVLIASGTATLEALLLKKPMVVAYKVAALTYWLAKRLVSTPFISLPNLLANKAIVPEILQDDATPETLGEALLEQLENSAKRLEIQACFQNIHQQLKHNADQQAAQAVLNLIAHHSKAAVSP